MGRRALVLLTVVAAAVLLAVGLTSAADQTGTDGPDKLQGTEQADTINGQADSDTIDAGDGNDKVAGAGCQIGEVGRYCDNPGNENIQGGAGDDDIRIASCLPQRCADGPAVGLDSVLHGGDGTDSILGADGRDQIFGEAGNDTIRGLEN